MRLTGRLISVDELTASDRDQMLTLMHRHYANVQPDRFVADLDEKDWVITVADRDGNLCGFSTQTVFDVHAGSEKMRVLFSGDTIVDREHWGDPALSHMWGRLALDLIESSDDTKLVWFLLSQGFRTYRFLPLFFHTFYPRYECDTPVWAKQFIDRASASRYGGSYDAEKGVIRAQQAQYHLRESLADISPQRLRDPHVRFFQRANPGYVRGDELCCVAPLTRENFTAAAWRVIRIQSRTRRPTLCRLPTG